MLPFLHNVKKCFDPIICCLIFYLYIFYDCTNFQQPDHLRYSASVEDKKVRGVDEAVFEGRAKVCWDDGAKSIVSINMLHSIDLDCGQLHLYCVHKKLNKYYYH